MKRSMPSLIYLFLLVAEMTAGRSRAQVLSTLWYTGDCPDPIGVGYFSTNQVQDLPGLTQILLEVFVVTDPAGWHVTSVFVNEFFEDRQKTAVTMPLAEWSIRQGVRGIPYWEVWTGTPDRGDGGNVVATGISPLSYVETGRGFPPRNPEFTASVDGLDVYLAPGTYWLGVAPIVPQDWSIGTDSWAGSFVTWGNNAIGVSGSEGMTAYLSHPGTEDFYLDLPSVPKISMGVNGFAGPPIQTDGAPSGTGGRIAAVPEPDSVGLLLGLCVPGLIGLRRFRRQ